MKVVNISVSSITCEEYNKILRFDTNPPPCIKCNHVPSCAKSGYECIRFQNYIDLPVPDEGSIYFLKYRQAIDKGVSI